jgi:type IV pilus modification protein PilV
MTPHYRLRQSGISLIEVLIALVVIAFGLLGIAGLQTSAIAYNYRSYQYTQASTLAQNMADRMRANRQAVLSSRYDLPEGIPPDEPAKGCANESCDPTQLAQWDLAVWYESISADKDYDDGKVPPSLSSILPGGKASIICLDSPCAAESARLVTVYWDVNRAGVSGYGCDPDNANDLACFRLIYTP